MLRLIRHLARERLAKKNEGAVCWQCGPHKRFEFLVPKCLMRRIPNYLDFELSSEGVHERLEQGSSTVHASEQAAGPGTWGHVDSLERLRVIARGGGLLRMRLA